jgi:hypothetical protein
MIAIDLEQHTGWPRGAANRIVFTEAAMRKLNDRAKKPTPATVKRGQWLLDALEGQPSECQGKHGYVSHTSVHYRTSHTAPEPCPDCRGTGHNLAGVLPRVEVDSPQLRRRYFDSGEGEDGRSWLRMVPSIDAGAGQMLTVSGPTKQTRVVPRGEHLDATEPAT